MRVISNALVSLMTDKSLSTEGKGNASGVEKLMELLRGAKNGELVLEAALKGIIEGKGKFNLSNLGNVEIPIPTNVNLPESGMVNIKFALQNEAISATILLDEPVDLSQTQSKTKTEDVVSQLKQLGLPQTEQNLKAVQLLNEYHIEPSADRIKQLAEGSFLASKATEMTEGESFEKAILTNGQKLDMSKTLKTVVVQWLGQQGEPIKSNTPIDSNVQNLEGLNDQERPKAMPQGDAKTNVKVDLQEGDIAAAVKDVKSTEVGQTLADLKTLLKHLDPKQLLPLIASDNKINLENLILSDQVFSGSKNIGQLKDGLLSKLKEVFDKLEPSKELIQEIVRWVEEDPAELTFKNQLEQLETIIAKHSPEAASEMKESFEQINKAMNFVEQMQNQLVAYHIPLQLGEHDTQVELYMNKRKGRQSQDEFRMFLALNTNEIGQVQVLITDQKSDVELQFKLETDDLRTDFENEKESLQDMLEVYSDKPVKLKFVTHSKEPAILEAFKLLREDQSTSIDMRV